MSFLARQLVGLALSPFFIVSLLLVGGLTLSWRDGTRRIGRMAATLGIVGVLLLGWGIPFDLIAGRLERAYPSHGPAPTSGVRAIVVLGGGHSSPVTGSTGLVPSDAAIARIVEGVRLHRVHPDSRLVFSGASGSPGSDAEVGRDYAIALGVAPGSIDVEPRARNTEEEGALLAPRLRGTTFLLVTSPLHVPRAMRVFQSEGLTPVAAPAPQAGGRAGAINLRRIIPSGARIARADAVMHEVLGLLWLQIRR